MKSFLEKMGAIASKLPSMQQQPQRELLAGTHLSQASSPSSD